MTKGSYNYNKLMEYCSENKIILLKDYVNTKVTRDTIIVGKCNNNDCENVFNKTFRQLKVSKNYCVLCTKYNTKIKVENTCLKNYGVKSVFQSEEKRIIMKNTVKEKYGVNNVSNSEKIKQKKQDTCIKNYGVTNSFRSPIIREKIKNTFLNNYGFENCFQSDIIKEKIKQTNLVKYGVENPQQSAETKLKTKNTCLKKYGVKSSILLPQAIQKRKEICLNKYNNEIPLRTELGQQIMKNTCKIKYGVENPLQNSEIAEKASKNSYNKKLYVFPSGNSIFCQGYEPFALDKLIKEYNISENDIVTGCKNVPQIWYYDENNKKHRHYVDIFIPSQNRCIEVKSTWTAEKKKDNIYLKQNAAKELGYEYEIWIFNSKKELVELKL